MFATNPTGYEFANDYRRGRGKKDVGHQGQASWISSVINLANTSTNQTPGQDSYIDREQSSVLAFSPCPPPFPNWVSS